MSPDPVDRGFGALAARIHREMLDVDDWSGVVGQDELERVVSATAPLCSPEEISVLVEMVNQRLAGLGPLEPLLADSSVSEIMVNGPGRVWVERAGAVHQTDVRVDAEALAVIIERIVAPLGLRVDRSSPLVDARLADGSRVHVALPPLAIDGPYLTIRRFRRASFRLTDFAEIEVAEQLARYVSERRSIIVSGGTGSGKTSLLNALASLVGSERIITIEDAAELRLDGEQVIRLEARPANAEGSGEVTVRALVRNALRMRPDRIIVGEVRGAEALDMVQAMNTGHEGSMSTCHANSAEQALARLETLMLMSDVDLPLGVARAHLRSAIDVVVQVTRSGAVRSVDSVVLVHDDQIEPVVRNRRLIRP